jgi:Fanconi anemia group M protein
MFHDIFQLKKASLLKKQNLPLIIADIHEKNSLVISELKASGQINLELKPLKIGDYLTGEVIVERKTYSDFISSMISKRLLEQLNQMKSYPKQILILEGLKDLQQKEYNFNPNAIRGAILSIINNHNIPIIFTQGYLDTAKYLIILAKQTQKPQSSPTLHSRIPKIPQEQKKYILESFPNIGPKTAEKLLEKFHTIKNIINAPGEELKDILKNNAEKFKDLVES